MRKGTEAAQRFTDRQRREDEAPRLLDLIPSLKELKLKVEERRQGATSAEVTHTRFVMVARAPALFHIPCSDPSCLDGGHDITSKVMPMLRQRQATFEGEDTCHGSVGTASCHRSLHYTAMATYDAET